MDRIENTRQHIHALWGAKPFRPFVLNLENGDRVVVEHPENCAFDPEENGRDGLGFVSKRFRYLHSLSAISSLALLDDVEAAA